MTRFKTITSEDWKAAIQSSRLRRAARRAILKAALRKALLHRGL